MYPLAATRMLVAFFVGLTVLVVATLLDLWSGSLHPIRPTDPPARGTAANPRLD